MERVEYVPGAAIRRLERGRQPVPRWSEKRWDWTPAVAEPLTDVDLAAVIDSIPDG